MDRSELRLHAAALAVALRTTDISTLGKPAADALGMLFDEVTYDRREALAARKRVLWREAAITLPVEFVLNGLIRTQVISDNANPAALGSMALVRRIDTGLFYLISTNNEETLTVLSDESGAWPEDSHADSILAASGRGLTRASALEIIDRTDALVTDGERNRWYDNDN
jgi:hypothetical protein